jgi:lipopolysaccharide export LptBFGC system permease protein LptF
VPGNGEITFSPHERLSDDLIKAYLSERETSADMIGIETELADRFATPLYAFPFACLALGFLGRPRSTRAHRMSSVLYTIAGAAIIRVAGFVFIVNGKDLPFYLFGSIAFPLICALIILIFDALFGHRLSQRAGLTLFSRNVMPSPSGQAS